MTAPANPAMPRSVLLVGAGKMGLAMLEGWLGQGLAGDRVTVMDPHVSADAAAVAQRHGIVVNPAAPGPFEVVVLAIKPQTLDAAAPGLAPLADGALVVSVLAGKTVADLSGRLPKAAAFVRAMPNLPASIGHGATGAFAAPGTSPRQRDVADALLKAVGIVEWVDDEGLIDAVTAVSGSGPAYIFLLAETLARAGVEAGLPAELAARLACATVSGAGALIAQSDLPPARLRENVTSPGGTTAAALTVLMDERAGMEPLLVRAVAAAKRRAGELSG